MAKTPVRRATSRRKIKDRGGNSVRLLQYPDNDYIVSALLVLAALCYAWRFVDFSIPPFEDAAMLMRYAQHLAQGYGIVWNIGEPPIDGATDFLFMAASAALIRLGLTVGQAIRGLGFAAHLVTVLLIYWTNRRVNGGSVVLSAFSALYLAVGTGFSYVAAYFGTTFFALAAGLTWTFGLLLMNRPSAPLWLTLAFAASGLVTGLIRPEGVLLASLMLATVVIARGVRQSMAIIAVFAAVFIVFGGAYFAWRWNYFGYPLPNPFYKKGQGALHWDSFQNSLMNTLRLCWPFALAFILGFRSKPTARFATAALVTVVGFAAAFALISDETNFGARFQYALVPIVLMSWMPLVRGLSLSWPHPAEGQARAAYLSAAAVLFVSLLYYSSFQNCFLTSYQQTCDAPYEHDGRYEMGRMLAEYRGKGYVIATTEAGLIPYYSGWTAVDTWGLNDAFIAHNGSITTAYLEKYNPNIIMFHDYYSPLVPPKLTDANLRQRWFAMTVLLKGYAEDHGYVLAAIFGDSPYDTHYYYVRSDFADSAAIVSQISSMKKYYYPTTGKKAINYATYIQN